MKKYKFLFLFLLFGFFFIPKDVFARTEVRLLKGDYTEVARCVDQECINGTFYADVGPVKRIMLVQDGYSIPANMKYKWYLDFSLSYTPSTLSALGIRVGQSGNTWMTPTWNYEVVNRYFDSVYGSPTNRYHVNATFTTLNQGDTIYTDIDLGEDIWVYNFTLYAWRLTALGSETNDIIFNQTQELIDNQNKNQQETNDRLDKIDDTLNDDDTSSSESQIDGFFNNFEDNHHGLSSVISAPLVFIRNLLNHSCEPLRLKLPFVDTYVNLPCMKSIYQEHFGLFFNLYQTITTGVIAYAVFIRMFATIKGLQDPQNDKIEVFNL